MEDAEIDLTTLPQLHVVSDEQIKAVLKEAYSSPSGAYMLGMLKTLKILKILKEGD